MQFCLDKEPKCQENGQLLDVITSTAIYTTLVQSIPSDTSYRSNMYMYVHYV